MGWAAFLRCPESQVFFAMAQSQLFMLLSPRNRSRERRALKKVSWVISSATWGSLERESTYR